MKGLAIAMLALGFAGRAAIAAAHPVPFSYLDIRIQGQALDVTLIAHIFDVAHDLGVEPNDRLLDPAFLRSQASKIVTLVDSRLRIEANGRLLTGSWSEPEALVERNSIQRRGHFDVGQTPASIGVTARLFPYDPAHETFVNFYERDAVASQIILDDQHAQFEYFTGTPRGLFIVARRMVWTGLRHMLTGPDHFVFLTGLLLLGGTLRRQLEIAAAFTLAHLGSLSLALFSLVTPRPRLIEPAIALIIVYVGVDNLLVQKGRDMRVWIAAAFGVVHGSGFAGMLRIMELSRRALAWSIVPLHIGVAISQLVLVVLIGAALAMVRARSDWATRQLAVVGSVAVITAGTFWFIQRVFFPGVIS